MQSSKPVVDIYLKTKSESAKMLTAHLAKHIDQLNELIMINFIYITEGNAQAVQRKGIRRTPTLIYYNRTFEGLDKIIKVLTPPKNNSENYGYGVTSPDEMLDKWQSDIIDSTAEEEEEDDMSPEARSEQIRRKMAQMQKNRPQMHGVPSKNKISGGRKLTAPKAQKEYSNDDDFLNASGISSVKATPASPYVDSADGELILEDYYLDEALKNGKKTKSERRRPQS
jgi:hypothetical protein